MKRSKIPAAGAEEQARTYVGGEEGDVFVTVEWLDSDKSGEPFVHLTVKATEGLAKNWRIDWFHFASFFSGNLKDYLDRYCPRPEAVWEAARSIELPPELDGLFGVVRKFERETLPTLATYDS